MHKYCYSICILLSLWAHRVHGQDPYLIDNRYPVQQLDQHILVLEDTSGTFNPEAVLVLPSKAFALRDDLPDYLEVGTTYWGRISLHTNGAPQQWILDLEDQAKNNIAWIRSNGKVDVYGYVENQLIFHKKTGVGYPRKERDLKDHWVLNRVGLDMPPGKTVTLLIRVEGNSFGVFPYFNLSLRSSSQADNHPLFAGNTTFHVFMFGVTFIIFLYHFLQFLYLQQRIFFWFSLWLFLCTVTQAMAIGIDAQTLLANFPQLRFPLWLIIPNSALFTFWLFGRVFVNSKEKYPLLDRFMLAFPLIMIANIVVHLILHTFFESKVYITQIGWNYYIIGIYSLIALVLSIILAFKKDAFARYFGIGAILASVATLTGALWSLQIIRVTIDLYTTGTFVQVVAYSFGIAYRQQQLTKQSEREKLEATQSHAEMLRIKDLDTVKTKFFTNLSHEFRTPLSLILGPLSQAERLAKQVIGASAIQLDATAFNMIKNNAKRLQVLIDQLLELSKLENSKVVLNLRKGGLISFIRSLVFSFESYAERKNITLNTNIPKEQEEAYFDSDKLEKILSNLLSNAFKYTPNGGTVSVNVSYDECHYYFSIDDTGPGIAQEELPRIFERFYRVESAEEMGSGIGLALVKELVDLQNGEITVQSEPNQLTSFKVKLPHSLTHLPEYSIWQQADVKKELPKEVVLLNETVISSDGESLSHSLKDKPHVLIVEDNKDLAQYISSIVQGDFEVILARDGEQGERMAFEHIPDLVISDIMMPKKDGYALCQSLKTSSKTSHIPILLLTAKATHEDKLEGLSQGADAYLTKPFDGQELLIRLTNLIGSRQKLWEHFKSLDGILMNDLDLPSLEDQFLQNVFKVIRTNLDNEQLSVEIIGREVGFSRSQLHRKLKALINKSPSQLIMEVRLNEAKKMLEGKVGTVSEVAYSVGYSSMSYFTKSFKEKFGVLPSRV